MNDDRGEPDPPEAPAALFTRVDGTVVPTVLSTGPWSAEALHGGPVAALLAHELEAVDAPGPLFPARLTMELFRPVTFTAYRVTTRVVRPGRRVRVLEASLIRADTDEVVARATLQQHEARSVALPDGLEHINGPERRPPNPEQFPERVPVVEPTGESRTSPFDTAGEPGLRYHSHGVEHRSDGDLLTNLGRATDWIRLRVPLFEGEAVSRLERVAAAADFGNGISNVLPFDDYVFMNTDLTIHLFRLPIDQWVCLDAVTRIGLEPGNGSVGLSESVLFDRRGRFGRALQSVLVFERQ